MSISKLLVPCFIFVMLTTVTTVQADSTSHLPVVDNFELDRYLGKWYEIVRSDHRFERDLSRVTATYTRKSEDRIKVLNRGFNTVDRQWEESSARGYVDPESKKGEFSVSFFWPFRARYRILELGDNYQYAVVTSNSMDYFWILNRTPEMDKDLLNDLLEKAEKWGFDTEEFIMVEHSSDQ